MKRTIFIFSTLIIFLYGCGSGPDEKEHDGVLTEAAGDRFYGGIFRLNESEYLKNLFPHNITDAYSYRVASQIYEGLFKLDDSNLQVINGLAESFEMDETGSRIPE